MTNPRHNLRDIYPPTGPEKTAKTWAGEAAMRMLMNNLHPDVAENPHELVVYGGIGRAARTWKDFDLIVDSLRHWVSEMHVDGFRFDLASILSRGPAGEVLPNGQIVRCDAAVVSVTVTFSTAEVASAGSPGTVISRVSPGPQGVEYPPMPGGRESSMRVGATGVKPSAVWSAT